MPDHRSNSAQPRSLLLEAEQSIADTPDTDLGSATEIVRAALSRVEAATPGGAPLHAQLDNVRKWLGALERPADYERFGGASHLRAYVLTQLRLALGALDDYQRETR